MFDFVLVLGLAAPLPAGAVGVRSEEFWFSTEAACEARAQELLAEKIADTQTEQLVSVKCVKVTWKFAVPKSGVCVSAVPFCAGRKL